MVKAIIFDLNGVFIKSPKLSDRFAEEFGVSVSEFLPVLKDILGKVRMPNASDSFIYWQPYLLKWGVGLSREQFFDFWFIGEKEVREMVEFARMLKNNGFKLFILSNNFKERSDYYERNFPFLREIFDRVYYSWQTGFVKSNPEAYKNLLKDNNLQPEEVLFFDDSKENVDLAASLGIKAFIFNGVEDLKLKLDKI